MMLRVCLFLIFSPSLLCWASVMRKAFLGDGYHATHWADNSNPVEKVSVRIVALATLDHGLIKNHSHDYLLKNLTALQTLLPQLEWIDIEIHRRGYDRDLHLSLEKHHRLIPKGFKVSYHDDNGEEISESIDEVMPNFDPEHCHFGTKHKELVVASFSFCGKISGYIEVGSEEHRLYSVRNEEDEVEYFITSKLQVGHTYDIRPLVKQESLNVTHRIAKRAIVNKYRLDEVATVKIFVVMGHSLTSSEAVCSTRDMCLENVFKIMAMTSSYYDDVNIHIVLMRVRMWHTPTPNPLGADMIDYGSYRNITNYIDPIIGRRRRRSREPRDADAEPAHKYTWAEAFYDYQAANDDMQDGRTDVRLAFALPPNGNEADIRTTGVSWGAVCWQDACSTVVWRSHLTNLAKTVAHEIGHDLGAAHLHELKYRYPECYGCDQSNATHMEYCVMNRGEYPDDGSGRRRIYYFSPCALKQIHYWMSNKWACGKLYDFDKKFPSMGTDHNLCGNYVKELAEDCDAGPDGNACCTSSCTRMKYNTNYCYDGACCDMDTCSVVSEANTTLCRNGDGLCDTPEMCDGQSEFCPIDVKQPDGTPCNNMGPGFCYDWECNTHSAACAKLWKGAIAANDDCYDLNHNQSELGNCGYGLTPNRTTYMFAECGIIPGGLWRWHWHWLCGLLQCDVPTEEINNIQLEGYHFLTPSVTDLGGKGRVCVSVMQDPTLANWKVEDPTRVPDGAACGDYHVCREHGCVNIRTRRTIYIGEDGEYVRDREWIWTPKPPSTIHPNFTTTPAPTTPNYSPLIKAPGPQRPATTEVVYYTTPSNQELYEQGGPNAPNGKRQPKDNNQKTSAGPSNGMLAALIAVPLVALLIAAAVLVVEVFLKKNYASGKVVLQQ